jgi:hypothetical protein
MTSIDWPQLLSTAVVEFDADKHAYYVGGRQVPSVTQLLYDFGMVDTGWYTEAVRMRGTVVHTLCELDDSNDLDDSSVDERLAGYLKAWRTFRSDTELEIGAIEQIVHNDKLGFCGRLDRLVRIRGRLAILDIKTGVPVPAVALQLAGYASCYENSSEFQRIAVQIRDDGDYRVREFPTKEFNRDLAVFRGLCSAYHWKLENL